MTENNSTLCLVCAYDLGVTIKKATNDYVICPSCGIQYGYADSAGGSQEKRERIYKFWREAWIINGRKPLAKEEVRKVISSVMKNTLG
jgi:hypothetical protein